MIIHQSCHKKNKNLFVGKVFYFKELLHGPKFLSILTSDRKQEDDKSRGPVITLKLDDKTGELLKRQASSHTQQLAALKIGHLEQGMAIIPSDIF